MPVSRLKQRQHLADDAHGWHGWSGGLVGKHPIDGCTAHAKCRSNSASRFTAGVHPLRQRQWRRERNWSQEDVADKLRMQGFDMHQTTVAKIERGTRPLRVAEGAAIAAIFRVPPLAVFLGPPPTQMPRALNQLHDMIASAQNLLDEMKDQMTNSAGRYVDQEAHVNALARILNQTALAAEMGGSGQQTTNNEGGEDDAEA